MLGFCSVGAFTCRSVLADHGAPFDSRSRTSEPKKDNLTGEDGDVHMSSESVSSPFEMQSRAYPQRGSGADDTVPARPLRVIQFAASGDQAAAHIAPKSRRGRRSTDKEEVSGVVEDDDGKDEEQHPETERPRSSARKSRAAPHIPTSASIDEAASHIKSSMRGRRSKKDAKAAVAPRHIDSDEEDNEECEGDVEAEEVDDSEEDKQEKEENEASGEENESSDEEEAKVPESAPRAATSRTRCAKSHIATSAAVLLPSDRANKRKPKSPAPHSRVTTTGSPSATASPRFQGESFETSAFNCFSSLLQQFSATFFAGGEVEVHEMGKISNNTQPFTTQIE